MAKERKDTIARGQSVEHLRTELQKGVASLDRGEDQGLDVAKIVKIAHARCAGLYRLSDAERAAARQGIEAAKWGHFAPEDEMDEFYRLHQGE